MRWYNLQAHFFASESFNTKSFSTNGFHFPLETTFRVHFPIFQLNLTRKPRGSLFAQFNSRLDVPCRGRIKTNWFRREISAWGEEGGGKQRRLIQGLVKTNFIFLFEWIRNQFSRENAFHFSIKMWRMFEASRNERQQEMVDSHQKCESIVNYPVL